MRVFLVVLLGGLGLLACSGVDLAARDEPTLAPSGSGPALSRENAREGARVAKGSLLVAEIDAMYGVILPSGVEAESARSTAAARLAATALPVAPVGTGPARVEVVTVPELPYNAEFLPYFGVDLSPADEAGLHGASEALRITVPASVGARMESEHAAAAVAAAMVAQTGGWVQDLWTNQTIARAAFPRKRPSDGPADVRRLTVIHAVADVEGTVLLDTAGLSRFGLPELVIHGLPRSYADELQLVLNAAGQTLVEQGGLPRDGELDVNLSKLSTEPWPETAKEVAAAGGSGVITLGLRWGEQDERAPGWEMEIVLPGVGDAAGRAYDAVKFERPPEQEGIYAKGGDAELEAARDRARAKLRAMAPHFANGMPDGEQLNVKGPFSTKDGQVEWMWVEVTAWNGDTLSGILLNDPFATMKVRAGDRVTVKVGDAYDYAWQKADGSVEGDETTAILERKEGR